MNNFLLEYQKILQMLLNHPGRPDEKLQRCIDGFLARLDATIESYILLTNRFNSQIKRMNEEAESFCQMRNLIQLQLAKENHESEK